MGMGYMAGYAYFIAPKDVQKNAPVAWSKFEQFCTDAAHQNLETALTYLTYGYDSVDFDYHGPETDDEDSTEQLKQLVKDIFKELASEFKSNTGLTLHMGFHDTNDGDRYDEIDGAYFCLVEHELFKMTPEAENFKDCFERRFFVTFG